MHIYLSGSPLLAYTSGTPMRGMVDTLIRLKPDWQFFIEFMGSGDKKMINLLFEKWYKLPNVNIKINHQSHRWQNLKKLIGIGYYHPTPPDFDCYIGPGSPERFKTTKPSVSFVADLSSINMPEYSSLKWHGNKIFRNMLNAAVKTNTKIVAISDFTRTELEEKFPKHRHKFLTIHNGIENFWFDQSYEENNLTKAFANLDYWIWWGFMSNRKNIDSLTKAYLQLLKEGQKLPKILFIGDIATDQLFLKQIFNDHSEYFFHYPFQEAYILKTLVKNSKGLLFPSLYEGFGLPVIEAFSQGIPVMHSNITSLPEIGGGLGIEIDPHDVSSIKKGLLSIANQTIDDEFKNRLKQRAVRFTYEKAAKQLIQLIEEITKR